ncbi:MAG: methyltransferase domain-containing protein [Proteobacteria bacterium]|nr:methyltransferase domain-containing protein [Pseudomonadota bacterium]
MTRTPRSTHLLEREVGRGVFGSDIAGYHAARVSYSDALIDRIFAYCDTPRARVVEIGPGTGLATQALLRRDVSALVALEPDRRLADHLAARFPDPRLTVLAEGLIEAQPGTGFDLVCSACAFHWINPQAGLAKVREVLRPGGAVALVWHSYRNPDVDPFFAALHPYLAGIALPPSEGENGYVYLDARMTGGMFAQAGLANIEFAVFRTERLLDAGQMCALYDSFSFVRVLPDARRAALMETITRIVTDEFAGLAPNIVLSPLHLARSPVASA